jgi:hypothetical protein
LSNLFDDDLTNVSSVLSFGSSPDITWKHVPSYLSNTSVSVSNGSMPDLETVSDSSAATSMPDLRSVSDSDDDSASDWFSEVEEDKLSDDLADNLSETSFEEIAAGIGEEDMEEVAAIISEGFRPTGRVDLYDSGSTQHLSPYRDQFTTYQEIPPKSFTAANKQKFHAMGSGEMIIEVPDGADVSKMKLTEVLYSPEIGYTLVSIGRLNEARMTTTFGNGQCAIRDADGSQIGSIPRASTGLYRVIHESVNSSYAATAKEATTHLTPIEFHRQMGPISPTVAKRLVSQGFVTGVSLDTSSADGPIFCESCTYAKSRRDPIPKVRAGKCATEFGGEIHSDVWGPAPIETIGGRHYFVSFTDDHSRLTHIYLLRHKSDTFEAYRTFEAWTNTQLDHRIKVLHTDCGGEYLSSNFVSHLAKQGTVHKLTVHDTPKENGVAEVFNHIGIEQVRAILHASGLPKRLWGEALCHMVWLKKRTSTAAVASKTPHEVVTGTKLDLSKLPE